jgi:hypothetical protein
MVAYLTSLKRTMILYCILLTLLIFIFLCHERPSISHLALNSETLNTLKPLPDRLDLNGSQCHSTFPLHYTSLDASTLVEISPSHQAIQITKVSSKLA